MMTTFEAFGAAHRTYLTDPAALTDVQIKALDYLDPGLAAAAVAARTKALRPHVPPAAVAPTQGAAVPSAGWTQRLLEGLAGGLVPVLKEQFAARDKRLADLDNRIAELQSRLQILEGRPTVGVKYCGTFSQGSAYGEGSLCTRSGGLWLATCDTVRTPGADGSWKLIVKSGGA